MSEANQELQSLIDELRDKLPAGARVELISDDQALDEQSQPEQSLPPGLIEEISQAAEALARSLFGNDVVIETSQTTRISPMDSSAESKEALKSLFKGLKSPKSSHRCYHYILDDNDQPVHVEDEEEAHRFQVAKKDIVATQRINCVGIEMRLTTRLAVHNPVEGEEIPKPHWVTELFREYTAELVVHEVSHSIDEARSTHRKVREEVMGFAQKGEDIDE